MKLRYLYRAYRARYRDQRHEISAARAALHPGDTAADIGAHKGAYLYWLKHAVGKAGKVHAFEPQSSLAAYLQTITHTMHWQNVFVHECALADRAATSRLHVPGDGDSPSASLGNHVSQYGPNHSYDCVVDTLDTKLQGSKQVSFFCPRRSPPRGRIRRGSPSTPHSGTLLGRGGLLQQLSIQAANTNSITRFINHIENARTKSIGRELCTSLLVKGVDDK